MLRGADDPFATDGGLRMLDGNLGRAVIKTSAVKPEHRQVKAPARVFDDQADFLPAFQAGALEGDFVAVLRFQGPAANGMPELHKLTPALGVLQDRGQRVALVTDGRMSGASGKVPAAIHLTPEASVGGPLSRVQDGDLVTLDADAGVLDLHVSPYDLERARARPRRRLARVRHRPRAVPRVPQRASARPTRAPASSRPHGTAGRTSMTELPVCSTACRSSPSSCSTTSPTPCPSPRPSSRAACR